MHASTRHAGVSRAGIVIIALRGSGATRVVATDDGQVQTTAALTNVGGASVAIVAVRCAQTTGGLHAAAEVSPSIGIDERGAGRKQDLAIVVSGSYRIIRNRVATGVVANDEIARAIDLKPLPVVLVRRIPVHTVAGTRCQQSSLTGTSTIAGTGVVSRLAVRRDDDPAVGIGLRDTPEDRAAIA